MKRATGSEHDAVDALFASFQLDRISGWIGFLEAHAVAWAGVGAAWHRYLVDELTLDDPCYAELIAHDLSQLGVSAPVSSSAAFTPDCPHGMAYVLAGSRLGISTLRRNACPELAALDARRYLDERTGPDIFRSVLTRIETITDMGPTLSSARATFALFRHAALSVRDRRLAA